MDKADPSGLPTGTSAAGSEGRPEREPKNAAQTLTPPPSSDTPTLADLSGTAVQAGVSSSSRSAMGRQNATHVWTTAILQPGTVLAGRYEILQALGEGGMGAVYKARDRELDRLLALKVIRPDLAGNPTIIQRFKQELILARQVTHRNVVRIFDLGEADGIKFITMEFIEGKDLRSLLQERKKFSPEEATEVIRQVCLALDAAHAEGVIHRDLKPQNIMRDAQGRIVVMDFGLARSLQSDGMTQTGVLIGTMEYMSPEQGLGQELNQRSDLFTLGLIFYELLTGQVPYKAESALASLLKRTQERAVPISVLDNQVPRVLSNIVARCLERDPKLRYSTAKELLTDLEAWQDKSAAGSIRLAAVHVWGRDIWWSWLGVAVVVIVLAGTGYLLRARLFAPSPVRHEQVRPDISLAILPFRNASGDASLTWLGSSLADMLSTDVGQSTHVRVVSPERVHQILADLRIVPEEGIEPITLNRVAQQTSADTVVWGQYARFGDRIRIDATVQDLKHDRRVPVKIEGVAQADIPAAVDRLAEAIRQNLAVSSDILKELKASSFQPSSKSADALRDYSQGVQFLRTGKNLDAVKAFQAATNEDPQFALAYSRLAEAESALGHESNAERVSRQAIQLDTQLPTAEKYLIEASHAHIMRDSQKAIAAYENLAKTLPGNVDVQYALGSLYEQIGAYDKARAQFSNILAADPKNIKALWQMGVVEINNNPQAALDPLVRGLSIATQVDNQEQKALLLQAIGVTYRLLNKPEDALRYYRESMTINEKLGQERGVAASLNEMGQVLATMGNSAAALTSFNKALKIRRDIGARKELGDTLIDLGNFYNDRGQYDQALRMYKESLQIQRAAGDQNYEALCLNNIGEAYFFRGQYDDALTNYQQALSLREQLKTSADIADTVHNLAETYVKAGQYDQGITAYLRALDLRRKDGDARGAALESSSLSELFAQQGRYGAAASAGADAAKAFSSLKERSAQTVLVLSNYGQALGLAGQTEGSRKTLDEALAVARELKNDALIARILDAEGDNGLYRGDFTQAKTLYQQALEAARRSGQPEPLLISKIELAKLQAHVARSKLAIQSLRNLGQQADAAGLKYSSVECSVYAAEALLTAKEYALAREQLQEILGRSEKLGLRMQSMKIHYLLAAALRLSGDFTEATGQYREVLRLLDQAKQERGADHLLDRPDLHSIYSDSTNWTQAGKG